MPADAPPAVERARAALAAVDAAGRPEIWITRVDAAAVLAAAAAVDQRVADGEDLPLAGAMLAVKDNIDVAGLPTTAACPAFAHVPEVTATAVQRLLDAGAVLIGKTNMDQFATGLVGTRSPYGAVGSAADPALVAGGSSSGSAVAVALGMVDIALGTDTAGSGRVPAACNGIIGIKPTYGLVPVDGVVPACASYDCVSVFARSAAEGEAALAVMADAERLGPDAPLGLPGELVVAVPDEAGLVPLADAGRAGFDVVLEHVRSLGAAVVPISMDPFFAAGDLLYGGALVAERHDAVGAFVDAHPDSVDPVVGPIISAANSASASELARDLRRLRALRAAALGSLAASGACALLVPTIPFHPTIDEVAADPVHLNARLGRYTTFVNLLGMAAVAVPAGRGVSVVGPARTDLVLGTLARRLLGEPDGGRRIAAPALPIVVVGAHLSGQPLNHQLTSRGGRLVGAVRTAHAYRLHALDTVPPKPGLVRVASGGGSVAGELWELPTAGFGSFVAEVPPPLVIGTVELSDGTSAPGFLAEPFALERAPDITHHGGWLAYLGRRDP